MLMLFCDAKNAAECVGGIFVRTDSDSVDAHLDDWVIVAAWLGHVAEVENVGFFDGEFFEKMGHAEHFVHAWGDGVDGGGAADFVIEFWG